MGMNCTSIPTILSAVRSRVQSEKTQDKETEQYSTVEEVV